VDGISHTHQFGKRKIGENDYLSLETEKHLLALDGTQIGEYYKKHTIWRWSNRR
jgi:hypothetical protein